MKLLEMTFFIPSNTLLGVVKLHVFGKKILGTLGDALMPQVLGRLKRLPTSFNINFEQKSCNFLSYCQCQQAGPTQWNEFEALNTK